MSLGSTLKNHIHTKGSGLFGAAGPIDRQIAVETCLFRDADHFSVYLAQDDTRVLSDIGNKVKHLLQLFLGHKARCSVGAFGGVNQVAFPVIFAGFTVTHPHDHEDQHSQRSHTAAHTVQTIGPAEYSANTSKESGIGQLRCGSERSAGRLPYIVVVEELCNIAAPIEQGGQSDGQDDKQFNNGFL